MNDPAEDVDYDWDQLNRAWRINEDPARWNALQKKLHPRAYRQLQKWDVVRRARLEEEQRLDEEDARRTAAEEAQTAQIRQEREHRQRVDDVVFRVAPIITNLVESAGIRERILDDHAMLLQRQRGEIDAAAVVWTASSARLIAEIDSATSTRTSR